MKQCTKGLRMMRGPFALFCLSLCCRGRAIVNLCEGTESAAFCGKKCGFSNKLNLTQ